MVLYSAGQQTEQVAAGPGPDGCLAEVEFLVESQLGGLAEPSSTLLNWTLKRPFPSVDEEMLLEILLACEVLLTNLTGVRTDV